MIFFTQKYLLLTIIVILVIFVFTLLIIPFPSNKLSPEPSTVIVDKNGKILRITLAADQMWRIPIKAEDISPALKMAVLTYEDRHFYYHCGINPISIVRALFANIRAGKIVQGGSTITMQIARMMEPKPRTIKNKLIEMFRAVQLELRYTKDEILTYYFNLAPYGGNIVGVGAASYLYFNKQAKHMSLGEACLLAAIPNSPNMYRPDFNANSAKKARLKLVNLLIAQNKISQNQKMNLYQRNCQMSDLNYHSIFPIFPPCSFKNIHKTKQYIPQ